MSGLVLLARFSKETIESGQPRVAIAVGNRAAGVLQLGDLAFRHDNGATFAVERPSDEQPRADALQISPTGPMPGPDMLRPTGDVAAIERQALADVGLDVFVGIRRGVLDDGVQSDIARIRGAIANVERRAPSSTTR